MTGSLVTRLLAQLLGLALALAAGIGIGTERAGRAEQTRYAALAQKAALALGRAQADGAATAGQLREQLVQSKHHLATLQERLAHAPPLTAAVSRACRRVDGADHRAGPAAHAAGAGPADVPGSAAAGAAAAADGDGVAGFEFSLAGLSLWDSALAGVDVSAGACRADGLAEPACAAGAGIELAQAFANHAANAAACREDRARYQRLIDYLQRRQADAGQQEDRP